MAEPEKDLEWNDTEFWDEEDAEVDEGDEERSASPDNPSPDTGIHQLIRFKGITPAYNLFPMSHFQLWAQPPWVNLLILIPLVAAFSFRRAGHLLGGRRLIVIAFFAAAFGFAEASGLRQVCCPATWEVWQRFGDPKRLMRVHSQPVCLDVFF